MAKYIMFEEEKADRIKPEHRRKYKRICKQMQELLNEIEKYEPEVNLYVEDSSNWNLMIGATHNDNVRDTPALHENVALCCTVHPSSGGGW